MSDPSPSSRTPTRRRAEQDRAIAKGITQTRQTIEIARDDSEIALRLAERGYDGGKLAEGLALQDSAQAAFNARQTALAAQRHASAARVVAEMVARQTYADFRRTARAVFRAPADRTGLSVSGIVPKRIQRFLTIAHASYAAAGLEQYAGGLATYGFSAKTIAAAQGTLETLISSGESQHAAAGAATQATAQRDAAIGALNSWMRQFRQIVRVALRGRRDLAVKLGAD